MTEIPIESRPDRLELQIGWWKQVVAVLGIAVAGLVGLVVLFTSHASFVTGLMSKATRPDLRLMPRTTVAQRFVLVDYSGHTVATLGTVDTGSSNLKTPDMVKVKPTPSADKDASTAYRKANPIPPIAARSPDPIMAFFTGLLVVIGCIQAAIYRALLKASRLSERAWISLELLEVVGLEEIEKIRHNHKLLLDKDTIGYQLIARYALNNSGKTPARITEGAIAFEMVDEKKLPAEPRYSPSSQIPYLIAPNHPFRSIQGMVFSRDEIGEFIRNEKSLILVGFVRYLDIHNKQRETRFCLTGQNSPFPQIPIGFDAEHCP